MSTLLLNGVMKKYDVGRSDGYCGLELRYPNNANYLKGYASGVKRAESEHFERESLGPNDINADFYNI